MKAVEIRLKCIQKHSAVSNTSAMRPGKNRIASRNDLVAERGVNNINPLAAGSASRSESLHSERFPGHLRPPIPTLEERIKKEERTWPLVWSQMMSAFRFR